MGRSEKLIEGVVRRSGALAIVALGLALTTLASPYLWAQNGKAGTNTAQATLRLTVRVVPVAMPPAIPRSESDSTVSVAFHLPVSPPRMTVTEEIRPLPASLHPNLRGQDRPEPALLKTLTVVAR